MINQTLLLAGDDAYNLTKSLRFRSSASAYLNRTPASAGNRQIFSFSCWVKRGTLSTDYILAVRNGTGAGVGSFYIGFRLDQLQIISADSAGNIEYLVRSAAVYRDPSAWYHVVCSVDTTQAISSNRVKIYVNGSQVTALDGASSYPTQNLNSAVINTTVPHYFGREDFEGGTGYHEYYLTEVNFIDGQAFTPSSFGETDVLTGVWKPKKYAGTYGTNGFYLPFTDVATTSGSNAGLGKDFSGNGNYWNTNNISVTAGSTYDSMNDVPTLTSATQANYCVLSPIDTYDNPPTEGNLRRTGVGHGGSPWSSCRGTLGVSSGKWYFEATLTGSTGSVGNNMVGIMTTATSTLSDAYGGAVSRSYQANGGTQGDNPTGTVSSATSGDVIMCAFDIDAGKVWFGKNGTWFNSGVPESGTGNVFTSVPTTPVVPALHMYGNTGDNYGWFTNFGQRPFSYTPPTGFVALNTFNLPEPSIKAGNKHIDVNTYTGNGGTLAITNSGSMQPDLVWIKGRNAAYYHCLQDVIRGVSGTLFSNDTLAEETSQPRLSSFNSNGFTLTSKNDANNSGDTYVAWQWKANGAGSSNTAGSITSTVSANPTAGFSIVAYTGTGVAATVGHGLGVAPSMVIVKLRSVGGEDWRVYHSSVGSGSSLALNSTSAASAGTVWNNTSPTSSVFSIGTNSPVNTSGATIIAYCWAEVAGFSKFGSYTGNGSTDGVFVYTGFRPRWVLIKRAGAGDTTNWFLFDTARDTYNIASQYLLPNSSSAEGTYGFLDILSNGLKIRSDSGVINSSGIQYIYACFAENPFKNSLAR